MDERPPDAHEPPRRREAGRSGAEGSSKGGSSKGGSSKGGSSKGGSSKGGPSWQASLREAGPYLGLGAQIAGTVALFVGAGYLVDRWLGSSPWGLIVGGVGGMGAALLYIARVSKELGE